MKELLNQSKQNKDITPYWNNYCKETSSKLWLPTKTDWEDSNSKSFNLSTKMVDATWFYMKYYSPENYLSQLLSTKELFPIKDYKSSEITKSRKIRFYPDRKQKNIFKQWLGTFRFVYNFIVNKIENKEISLNWMKEKTELINELTNENPWLKDIPYQIKSIAI